MNRFNKTLFYGNQFGYLLNYIIKNKLENQLTNESLTEIYKKAYLLNNEDFDFANESQHIAFLLQHHKDKPIFELWKKCVDLSLKDAQKTFDLLDISMNINDTQGESFYEPFCMDIINDLLNKGIATKEEDGTVVVFFKNKSPLILQKSNGNYLYSIYDIAALKWREEHLSPDKIVYVVDKRQSLHFEQVFDIVKKANYVKPTTLLEHIGFGTILGADKKPLKTKSGQSLFLEDLFVEGKLLLSNTSYIQKLDDSIKDEVINKSIIGGLKFYDLKFNKNMDYIFDWNFVLNFSGGSAPYLQNAMTRIDSIFSKLGLDITSMVSPLLSDFSWSSIESDIIFQIYKCDELVFDCDKYASQILAENLINLAQLFHQYYESNIVIGSCDQNKKLVLLKMVYDSLKKNTYLLGIPSYRCTQQLLLNNTSSFSI